MGRCTVCSHSKRSEIEAALAQGESFRNIGKRFTVSYSAVNRHSKKCIGKALARAQGERERGSGLNVLAELESINAGCKTILATAKTKKDDRLSLQTIGRLCKLLELQARFVEVLQKQGPQEENKIKWIIVESPPSPGECLGCAVYQEQIKPWRDRETERTEEKIRAGRGDVP